ncbi:MAG: ABC transporter ATP-binding protein [Lentisphaerae bacterium]|jgi:ABC-type lipoprotein export system ATPase subunit|nr:ABC transporter ATP-binding protein [Lentisphaerota bacterium]MBT5607426.1 ABC transporter ATP-binding protein [Lentisphaerota bacterium]MBT7056134.1 ABC transporter ATP-binding protein [Lentisphaerota bacterium]MBT7841372.1 ABC transporter ATP-binding protein [Lentisphaerota bacterium]
MPDSGRIHVDFRGASSWGRGEAPAFDARDVCRQFRLERHTIDVLSGINLTVQRGEWVALVGRSGSGKTTLLQLLGSLDRPTRGEVFCHGRPYSKLSGKQRAMLRRDEIGFVFQSYHLFPELSAMENVALPALQWGWDRNMAVSRARELLFSFGLEERLGHRPQELSGGEQQRVAMARALVNSPDAILADEPTGNLDVAAGKEIVGILQRLHADQGKTIVMVTHDLALAKLADRVLLMQNGQAEPLEGDAAFPAGFGTLPPTQPS